MALVCEFVRVNKDNNRVHGKVDCGYFSFTSSGRTYFQLDTYGSTDRKIPGKVSQSIQLDGDGARELVAILKRTFPGIA
jgi:hypothetical protein